jgi:hypothetical protein
MTVCRRNTAPKRESVGASSNSWVSGAWSIVCAYVTVLVLEDVRVRKKKKQRKNRNNQ